MEELTIIPMIPAHLVGVAAIETAVSLHPWTLKQFAESLSAPDHVCLSVLCHQEVVGYIVFSLAMPGPYGEAEVLNIAVHPDYRNQGLGKQLLTSCMDKLTGHATKLFLEVRVSNIPAIYLYLSLGFKELGRRRDYYRLVSGGREDALLMGRDIGAANGR